MSSLDARVSVIVVNWNNAADTIRCLDSLAIADHYREMHVLVVDNGSTDDSVSRIRKSHPACDLFELKENRGYGGGCNTGHKKALEEGAEYVVFLNNDTVVDPKFLAPLLAPLREKSTVAITVPRIYFMDYPDRIWFAGGEVNLLTGRIAHRGIRKKDGKRFNAPAETAYATGCSFAMRASDFSNLGGFNENFALYVEDVDLSLRARRSGKKILYAPGSKVWHKVSASAGGELGFRKLWKKNLSLLRLLVSYNAWTGAAAYLLLSPFRLVRGVFAVFFFHLTIESKPARDSSGTTTRDAPHLPGK